jgi:hypothetical protein
MILAGVASDTTQPLQGEAGSALRGPGVRAEDADHLAAAAEVVEGGGEQRIGRVAVDVHPEDVLPAGCPGWPRLEAGEVHAARGERTKAAV